MHASVESEPGRARIRLNGRFDFSAHRVFRESYSPSLLSRLQHRLKSPRGL